MTIYKTVLAKGYLPKELPPFFFSEDFAGYATTKAGRATLAAYAPPNNFTECTTYTLALPGLDHRPIRIPHPKTFSALAEGVSKAFRRLFTKAGASGFSRSRPVYSTQDSRAIRTLIDPANLSRERAVARASGTFLLRADVSQFYPSLYTHAIGWAIDPKLRAKAHWHNSKLLGKRIDQLLMNMQGKVSQGIPIGNDISFLLAEIVLGQVDKELHEYKTRAFRWFDDYEIACDSRAEAETALVRLRTALARFNLRLNPKKTSILELPVSTSDGWQHQVLDASKDAHVSHRGMLRFFDTVFDLRASHAGSSLLLYAMGLLFKIPQPLPDVLRVAESCITQALLCEPGCAQKAFALLTYWSLNGASISQSTIRAAIERIVLRHETVGATSDVSWALAFCISQRVTLSKKTAKVLSRLDEDCVAIQALHAHSAGLLPRGFSPSSIERELRNASLDGPHWLALYEAVRHGFLPGLQSQVHSDLLFGDMLSKGVSFYRQAVPPYAAVVHHGGAPQWVVRAWLSEVTSERGSAPPRVAPPTGAVADMIKSDALKIASGVPYADAIAKLLAAMQLGKVHQEEEGEPYA
jgi:Reverse transcriptase (RNA-dependent DNA polymerase)